MNSKVLIRSVSIQAVLLSPVLVVALTQPTSPKPARTCSSLTEMKIENAVIFSAKEVPEGTLLGSMGPVPIPPQPAHCVVEGEINKHTGPDGNEYGDKFQLRLPDSWSGRFLFQGGGGLDGSVNPAVGPARPGFKSALARGYAVVSTDAGHEGKNPGDATFGTDPQARADYQFRSTDLVAPVAKKIIAEYYGSAPHHSYMAGCSNGGREAMLAAQRYPDLFDGIIAGDPAFDLTRAAIAEAWFSIKMAEIAPKNPSGMPLLSKAFADSDLKLVTNAVLKACDELDGLKDGLIDNPDKCHFDPATLLCKSAKNDTCLSPDQLRVLDETFAGPHDSSGHALYSDWPYDSGLAESGWRIWILGNEQMPAINVLIYPQFVNHVALLPGDAPIQNAFSFDFNKDPERINKSADLIDADSTDLHSFHKHGGKLILYTGMSDPVFSANDLIHYYQRLAENNGGLTSTEEFVRLFRIPGMNHCAGGPALDDFDDLTAIEDWVEKGVAPDRMIATGATFPGRSRPLCPYPSFSEYKGAGSTDDAANFTCENVQVSGSEKAATARQTH
jgi:pimeloyl-ACP methyl ester carboxylesterase